MILAAFLGLDISLAIVIFGSEYFPKKNITPRN